MQTVVAEDPEIRDLANRIIVLHNLQGKPGHILVRPDSPWDAPFLVGEFAYENWIAWHLHVVPVKA